MLDGQMRCGGCGCNQYTQNVCRCSFFRSVDCEDNPLVVQNRVVGTGIDPAGYTNIFPIKRVQESPCYWNLELDGITGSGFCLTLNKNYILGEDYKDVFQIGAGYQATKTLGTFKVCDSLLDETFITENFSWNGIASIFLAGDDPRLPSSGMWNNIDTNCTASGYHGPRPKVWMKIHLAVTSFPFNSDGDYEYYDNSIHNDVTHYSKNLYMYAKSDIVYSGDYKVNGWHITIPNSPDCDEYVDTGVIDGNTLDVTFSGFTIREIDYNTLPNNYPFSGCTPCDFTNLTARLTPYLDSGNSVTDYYNAKSVNNSYGQIPYTYYEYNNSNIHISGGYQGILVTFSGIISESDTIPSSLYRKSTCDCDFLNGTFYNNIEFPEALDNRNRFSICCECPDSGSPCFTNIRGYFTSYTPSGMPSYMVASKLEVVLDSDTYGIYGLFSKEFNNYGSGYMLPMDISNFTNLNIPYISGYYDQSKCAISGALCSISILEPLHTKCKQNDICDTFCDWKGPEEILLSFPSDFFQLAPEVIGNCRGNIFKGTPRCGVSPYEPIWCGYPAQSGIGTSNFYDLPFYCIGSGGTLYMIDSSTYNYNNCNNHIPLLNATTNYILRRNNGSRINPTDLYLGCEYIYENPAAEWWEPQNINIFFNYDPLNMIYNNSYLSARVNVEYGSGYFIRKISDPTNDGSCGSPISVFDDGCNPYSESNIINFEKTIYSLDIQYSGGLCNTQCLRNDFVINSYQDWNVPGCVAVSSGIITIAGI